MRDRPRAGPGADRTEDVPVADVPVADVPVADVPVAPCAAAGLKLIRRTAVPGNGIGSPFAPPTRRGTYSTRYAGMAVAKLNVIRLYGRSPGSPGWSPTP